MKIRYFLKSSNKPIDERITSELVYAEVSNRFGTKIDGKANYTKFQWSLDVYVKPHHFGTLQTKRGKTNFVYDALIQDKNKKYTSDFTRAKLDFEASLQTVREYFRQKGFKPSAKEFKAKLEEVSGRNRGLTNQISMLAYARERIEKLKKISGTGAHGSKEKRTIENAQTLLTHLSNYEEVRGVVLTFENIKEKYWDLWDVVDGIIKGIYSIKVKEGEKKKPINKYGLATNTLINYQLELRYICESALADGLSVSLSTNDKTLIHKRQKSSQQYAVNNSDLLTIYKHSPSNKRIQKAKDYVIFSCLTGMRQQSVTDVVNKEVQTYNKNGIEFNYLHTKQGKTKTECHTPLFTPVLEIIKRCGGIPNFSKDNNTINTQLKDLFTEAGLTYDIAVTKHYYKDGSITEVKPLNKLISSHDMRRGFVTNLHELGVNPEVSKLVVHPDRKSIGTTDLYSKITNEQRALKFYDEVQKSIIDNPLYTFDI